MEQQTKEVEVFEEEETQSKMRVCPFCKTFSRFVQTTCPSGKWVCTSVSCFGYTCSDERFENLEINPDMVEQRYQARRVRRWAW